VHFLNWVLEQDEEPGGLGLLSNLIYQDINNGCGLRFTEPTEWKAHFELKHRKTAKVLTGLLEDAYVSYSKRFSNEI
jgi:hypothetical protein